MKSPFPYFGGKSIIASDIWARLGDVNNYVEPFAGSLAVLLNRPHEPKIETVNDKDGFIANFWRALQREPETVAKYADQPVNENNLHAIHSWLVEYGGSIVSRLEGDPEFFDAKIAGWWVWGIACWIGSGWCSGRGPWHVNEDRQLVHLGDAGRGVNRKLVHLGDAGRGCGVNAPEIESLVDFMQELSGRLRRVRVCSGDWSRVCSPAPTFRHGLTGVFLDPPYPLEADRENTLYREESGDVAHDAAAWAIEQGENPLMRIAFCGYEGSHAFPESWDCVAWKAKGGYAAQGDGSNLNAHRERIWYSPHCLTDYPEQESLFATPQAETPAEPK